METVQSSGAWHAPERRGSCQRGVGWLHMHQGGDALASGASYDLFGLRRARELVVRVSVPVEA